MTSEREKKFRSERGAKRRMQLAFLPLNPTEEELQRFVDFLNGELDEEPQPPPKKS